MIVEQRTYVLHTGASLTEYLQAYEDIGLPAQKPILGGFLGYFVTEFGRQNELTHLWAYADLEERKARRAELTRSARWQECLAIIRPMIMTMENKIMCPTAFSPIRSLPVSVDDPDTAFSSR